MDSKQCMELTARTALLMEVAAGLIGVQSAGLAKLHMKQIAEAAMELDKFIEGLKTEGELKCNGTSKPAKN